MLDTEPSILDKIQQWVFSLSSTNFRPFRHTATVISLGFITTLCEIYAKVNKAHDNSNMTLEKEKKGKKAARIKELERMAEEQESQLKILTELMESTYDRYSPDKCALLMVVCLYIDLGMLIIVFGPSVFMSLGCGCRGYLKSTLTLLTCDIWDGRYLIRYFL
jgi:hypothetical protein